MRSVLMIVVVGLLIGTGCWAEAPEPRDPFVDPRGDLSPRPVPPVPGIEGKRLTEVRLRGIWVFGEEPMALLAASDGMGYVVREGTELWDARVDSIDFETGRMVVLERQDDPTASVRTLRVELTLKP